MKKLVTLLLAAGMVWSLAAPATAAAVDVKFNGTMDFTFERRNIALNQGYGTNTLDALQRLRLGMEFIASETLSGYYMLQVGSGLWGSLAKGSEFGNDFGSGHRSEVGQSRISTRFMYLDWIVPGTQAKIRMGKQSFGLPAFAFGASPAAGGIQAGVSVNVPINDKVAISGFWVRPSANEGNAGSTVYTNRFRNLDAFALAVPMKFDGFQVAPYIQVASVGNQAKSNTSGATTNAYGEITAYNPYLKGRANLDRGTSFAWWAGFASKLTMFDPFSVSLDFVYGSKNASGGNGATSLYAYKTDIDAYYSVKNSKLADRSGWMAALRMDYKTAYGVPTLLAWYGSGDGKSQLKGGGMLPSTTANQAGSIGTAPTFFDNAWTGSVGAGLAATQTAGTWGVSLQWNKFSFVEDLFHDFSVTYFQGTNNKANVYHQTNPNNPFADEDSGGLAYDIIKGYGTGTYLTTKDSAVDVALVSTYAIYKNLAANLELGYVFTNFDENIRAEYDNNGITKKTKVENIWRVALNFRYTF